MFEGVSGCEILSLPMPLFSLLAYEQPNSVLSSWAAADADGNGNDGRRLNGDDLRAAARFNGTPPP